MSAILEGQMLPEGVLEVRSDKIEPMESEDRNINLENQLENPGGNPCKKPSAHLGPGSFSISVGVVSLSLETVSVYIASQISTIEKVFNIDSTTSGLLMSCNDIGFLCTSMLMTHFLRSSHVPRALGIISIIYGTASFFCSLANFVDPIVLPADPANVTSEANALAVLNDSSVCLGEGFPPSVIYDRGGSDGPRTRSSWVLWVFALCLVVQGVAKGPRTPLAAQYIDDNVNQRQKTALMLGTTLTLAMFGLAVAFVAGSIFSTIPVDLSETSLDTSDPRWIGAWWLGFLVFGALSILVSVPLFFFPKRSKSGQYDPFCYDVDTTFWQKLRDLPRSLLRVLKNPVYSCILLGTVTLSCRMMGQISFGAKYLEAVFRVPTWKANMILGLGALASGGIGTFVGGVVVSCFKLARHGSIIFVIGCLSLAVLVDSMTFVLGCQNVQIHGLNNSEHFSFSFDAEMNQQVNVTCNCHNADFLPVCDDGVTYFSPCHAGCQNLNQSSGVAASAGICDADCDYLYPFLACSTLFSVLASLMFIPSNIIAIRSVPEMDKAMSVSLFTCCMSLLAYMCMPIVYGYIVDSTCTIWTSSCGQRGACALYDVEDLRLKFVGLTFGLEVLSLLFYISSFVALRCENSSASVEASDSFCNSSMRPEL